MVVAVIIPLRDANGVPDLTRMNQWTATCDRCDARTLLADIDPWLVGMHQEQAVYCPRCVRALAAHLIGEVFRPTGLPGLAYDTRHHLHTARHALLNGLPDRLSRLWPRRFGGRSA
ncbi:hypothetical protein [Actinomadura hibisca]|uniref:hypothetical protein n=1 Tax=Actinomadura hibisca TaxID=68565 RepID=UPI001471758D|nr:hypothetical protein [Actinomadura hibisca]